MLGRQLPLQPAVSLINREQASDFCGLQLEFNHFVFLLLYYLYKCLLFTAKGSIWLPIPSLCGSVTTASLAHCLNDVSLLFLHHTNVFPLGVVLYRHDNKSPQIEASNKTNCYLIVL